MAQAFAPVKRERINPADMRRKADSLIADALNALEQEAFGERTITVRAQDGHLAIVLITATSKHKLD